MLVDAEKERSGRRDEDFGAIDVAALLAQVTLEAPKGTVTVRGIVETLRPSYRPGMLWGILQGFEEQSTMSFQCPAADALRLKEHVILRGTLTAKKSTKHRRFDFELFGDRIGEWAPSEQVAIPLVTAERRKPKLSLERFLSKDTAKRLVLIGTKTAIQDAETTLDGDSRQILDGIVCTTGLDSLQTVIAEAAQKYDGLCLMRGGGDLESFATWNDSRLISALIDCGRPFYTALGHAHDLTLADKYADESFATASHFGSTYTEIRRALEEREKEQGRVDGIMRAYRKLKAESESAKAGGLDRNMAVFQDAIAELRQLPAALGKQAGQYIGVAVKASVQDDFRRPFEAAVGAAIQGPIADLNQATHHARDVMTKVARKSRFHTWTWLLSIFLLGVLIGGFGYHRVTLSRMDSVQDRLEIIQQQTAPAVSAPRSKSTNGKSVEGRRGR
jgi:exodeoxyribonuclease VII large subunit